MSAITLQGQLEVMADLLSEACGIIGQIDPDSTDESRRLAMWLDAAGRAVRAVNVSPGLDIDAIHFKLI